MTERQNKRLEVKGDKLIDLFYVFDEFEINQKRNPFRRLKNVRNIRNIRNMLMASKNERGYRFICKIMQKDFENESASLHMLMVSDKQEGGRFSIQILSRDRLISVT